MSSVSSLEQQRYQQYEAEKRANTAMKSTIWEQAVKDLQEEIGDEGDNISPQDMARILADKINQVQSSMQQSSEVGDNYQNQFSQGLTDAPNASHTFSQKNSGDNYIISADFTFSGTASGFAKNPSKTEFSLKEPLSQHGNGTDDIKHIITNVDINLIQNTFPFPVSFCLTGTPKSNVHVTGQAPNSVCTIPARCISPLPVDRSIYDVRDNKGFDGFRYNDDDFSLHDVTDQEIADSFTVPSFMENGQSALSKTGFVCIKADSPLALYIRNDMGDAQFNVASEQLHSCDPNMILMKKEQANFYAQDMKEYIKSSPFGRLDNIKGSICRLDGLSWDAPVKNLNEADLDDAHNYRQEVLVSVNIYCSAARNDTQHYQYQ